MQKHIYILCLLLTAIGLTGQTDYTLPVNPGTPTLDGERDALYVHATEVPFTTNFPTYGDSSRHPTRVWTAQDHATLYVYAELDYAAGTPVSARATYRDDHTQVDYFAVYLDPYRSGLYGYRFGVTAAGTRFDARFGAGPYDGVWDSAVRHYPGGWAVELRIPLTNVPHGLRFQQQWSLNLERYVLADGERSYWHPVDPRGPGVQRQAGTLNGLQFERELRYAQAGAAADISAQQGLGAVADPATGGYAAALDTRVGINRALVLQTTFPPDRRRSERDALGEGGALRWNNFSNFNRAERPLIQPDLPLLQPAGSEQLYFNDYGVFERRQQLSNLGPETAVFDQRLVLNHSTLTGRGSNGLGFGVAHTMYRADRPRLVLDGETVGFETIRAGYHQTRLALSQLLPQNGLIGLTYQRNFHPLTEVDPTIVQLRYQQNDAADVHRWYVRGVRFGNYLARPERIEPAYFLAGGVADGRGPWTWSLDLSGRPRPEGPKNVLTQHTFGSFLTRSQVAYQHLSRRGPWHRWQVGASLAFSSSTESSVVYAAPQLFWRATDRRLRSYRLDALLKPRSQGLRLEWGSDPRRRVVGFIFGRADLRQPPGTPNTRFVFAGTRLTARITPRLFAEGTAQLNLNRGYLNRLISTSGTTVPGFEERRTRRPEMSFRLAYTPVPELQLGAALYRYNNLERSLRVLIDDGAGSFIPRSATLQAWNHRIDDRVTLLVQYRPVPGTELRLTYALQTTANFQLPEEFRYRGRHELQLGAHYFIGTVATK